MGSNTETFKREAAERAVELVRSGMVVGLGHGSTAAYAVRRLAALLHDGSLTDLVAVPCSNAVSSMARELGIPLSTLGERPMIDLTIDGADEVDPHMDLIKGGGGALLREKLVARASRREVIVVDESKLSGKLGTRFALPIEVQPRAAAAEAAYLESLGARVTRRGGRNPFVTDSGNHILDCRFPGIDNPRDLARRLEARPEIEEHGLFLGLTTDLIVAGRHGVRHFTAGQDLGEVIPR